MWLVYALLAAALWGFEYALVGRILDDRFSPLFLVSLQMLVGAIVLGGICLATGTLWSESQAALRDKGAMGLIALSTLVFTFGNFMIAASIKEGNAVLAGFIEISYPLFIIAFSLMLGWGGTISLRTVLGGCIILAGVFILYGET